MFSSLIIEVSRHKYYTVLGLGLLNFKVISCAILIDNANSVLRKVLIKTYIAVYRLSFFAQVCFALFISEKFHAKRILI